MKQENFEYLSQQLKYLGFGDELTGDLHKNMGKGNQAFTLGITLVYSSFEKNAVQYDLNFRKGREDMYFLNSYIARLGEDTAKFYVNKGEKNITSKEAFNLMEGRAVYRELTNREGEKYHAWHKIDTEKSEGENIKFKSASAGQGYDLEAAMKKVVSQELFFGLDKDMAIESLKKGNLVEVKNMDKSEKYWIAADPQFKTLEIFDTSGTKLKLEDVNKEKTAEGEKQSAGMTM
ncbi:hypothetical protein [Niabella hirudinis]|uniref:hypothetical protein n=1 Tax=Niabella hirudinis TaxID=1285929 RepID=UPI003EBE2054